MYSSYGSQKEEYGFGREYQNTKDDYYPGRDRERDRDRDRHRHSCNHSNNKSSCSHNRDHGLDRERRRSPPSRPSENCDSAGAGTGHKGQGTAKFYNKTIFNDYERKPTFSSLNIKRTLDPHEIKVAELRKRLQNSTPYLQKLLKHFHDRGMDRVREEEINDVKYYLTLGKEVKYDLNHAECLDDALTQIINLSRKYPISMNDASEEEESSSGSDSDGDKKGISVPTESKNKESVVTTPQIEIRSENGIPLTALERLQQQKQLDQRQRQPQHQHLPGSHGSPDHNYNDGVRTVPKRLGENSGFDSDSDANKSGGDGAHPGPEFLRNPFHSRQFLESGFSSNNPSHDNVNFSDSDSSENNNVMDPWGSPVIKAKRKTYKTGQDQQSKNYSSLTSSTLKNNSNNNCNNFINASSCLPPGLRHGAGRGRGIRVVSNMSDSNIGLNITNPNFNNTRDNRKEKDARDTNQEKIDTSRTGPASKPAPNYTDWEGNNMKKEGQIRSSASPPTATCDSSRDRDRSMDRDRNRNRDLPLSPQDKDLRSNSPDSTTFNTCATQHGISSSEIKERRRSLSKGVIASTSTSTSTNTFDYHYRHGQRQENIGNVGGRQMWGSSSSLRPRSRSGSRSSSSSSSRSPSPRRQFDPADFEFGTKARSPSNLLPSQGQAKSQSNPVEEEPIRFDCGHGHNNNNKSAGQSRIIGIHDKYGYPNPLADVHLRAQQHQLGSQATATRTKNQIPQPQPLPLVQPQPPQDILPNPLFNYGHSNSVTATSGLPQGQITNTSQQNQQQQYMHSMMQSQLPQPLPSSIMPMPTPTQSQIPFQPQQQIMFPHAQQQQQQQNHQFQMPMPIQPGLGNLNANQQMMYQMAQGGQSYYQNQIQNPVTTMGMGIPHIRPGVPHYYLPPQQQQQQQQQQMMMMTPTPPVVALPQLQDPRQQSAASLSHVPSPALSTNESNDNNINFGYEQQPQVSADPRLRAQNQTPIRNHGPSPHLQSPPLTSTGAVNNSQLNSNNIALPLRPEEISQEMLHQKTMHHFGVRPRAPRPPPRLNTPFNHRNMNPNFSQNNNRSRYFTPTHQNNNSNRAPLGLGTPPGQAPRFRLLNPQYQNRMNLNRNFNRENQNLPRAPTPAAPPAATAAFDEDFYDNNFDNNLPSRDEASTATGSGGPSQSNTAPVKRTSTTAAPARKNTTHNSSVTQKSTYKDRIISRLQDVTADSMNTGDKGRPGSGSKLKQLRENLSKSGYYSLGQSGPRTQKIFEEAPLPSLAVGGKGASNSQKDKTKGAAANNVVGDQILEDDHEPNCNSGSEDAHAPATVKNKNSKNQKAKTSKDTFDDKVSKIKTVTKKKGGPKVKLPFSKNKKQPLKKKTGRGNRRVNSWFDDDDDESNSNNAENNFVGEASNTNTEIPELDSSSEEEIPSEVTVILRAFLEDDDMSSEEIQGILDNPASVREIYRLFKIEIARSCVNLSSVSNKDNENPPATTSAPTGSDLDSEIIDAGRKAVSPNWVEDEDSQDNNVFPGRVLRSDSRKNTPTKNSKCSSSHMNPILRLETLKFVEQSLLNEGLEKTTSSSKSISVSKKRKLTGVGTKDKRHNSDVGSKQPKRSKRGRKSVAVSAMVAAAAMTSVSSSTSGPSSSEDNSESSELDSSFQASLLQGVAAAVETKRKSLRNKNPAPSGASEDNQLMPPPLPPQNNADVVDQIFILHQPVIPVNTGLSKVKIESDYIPITSHVKMEAESE